MRHTVLEGYVSLKWQAIAYIVPRLKLVDDPCPTKQLSHLHETYVQQHDTGLHVLI